MTISLLALLIRIVADGGRFRRTETTMVNECRYGPGQLAVAYEHVSDDATDQVIVEIGK